jgi:hypothetical protein
MFLNYHQNKFYKEKAATQAILGFASYIVTVFAAFFINFISYKQVIAYYPLFPIILKGAAYTAVVAPFVFFILSKALHIQLVPRL